MTLPNEAILCSVIKVVLGCAKIKMKNNYM